MDKIPSFKPLAHVTLNPSFWKYIYIFRNFFSATIRDMVVHFNFSSFFHVLLSWLKGCHTYHISHLINGINDRYDKYDSYRASNVKFFFETNPTSTSLSIAFSTWPWSFTIVSTIYFCVHSGFSRISSSTSFCVAPNLDSRTSSLMLNPWPFRLRYFSHCSTSFPVTCKTQSFQPVCCSITRIFRRCR